MATTRPTGTRFELRLAQELNYLLIGKALQAGPNTRSALVGRVLFCSWNVGRGSVAAWAELAPPLALITKVRFRRHGEGP